MPRSGKETMNIEDLRETAALAHLNLDERELSGAFPAFEEMLGFFAAMRTADREASPTPGAPAAGETPPAGISAAARIVGSGWFRGDGAAGDGNRTGTPHPGNGVPVAGAPVTGAPVIGDETIEQMLNSAGERDGRFVVVPNVL
jgi:aspartyl-tRNA(Asn)/glutamyl-tRNA(Gln) amidotransferase subunit C